MKARPVFDIAPRTSRRRLCTWPGSPPGSPFASPTPTQTGTAKPVLDIVRESAAQRFRPLFRGTVPLMGHSFASATLGLVGQPRLQKYIQAELGAQTRLSGLTTNLIASAAVSPLYVALTNPLSRLEVIMQTTPIGGRRIAVRDALAEVAADRRKFGLRGLFRGQGIGTAKAVVSLTLFHEARIFLTDFFKERNARASLALPRHPPAIGQCEGL